VDYHSDLAEPGVDSFECGTWVSYVKWRKRGEYLWIRCRKDTEEGNCNNPYRWNEKIDWKHVQTRYMPLQRRKSRKALLPYLKNCVGIGICLSPSFSNKLIQIAARKLIREYQIPYVKGRTDEYAMGRTLKPPGRVAA
jgi:hypothetical protein